jgi:hypothetical protein
MKNALLVGGYLDSSSRRFFCGSRSYAGISQARKNSRQQPFDFASSHGNEVGVSRDEATCQEPWGTNEVAPCATGNEAITAPKPRAVKGAVTTCVAPIERRQILAPVSSQVSNDDGRVVNDADARP